MARRKAEVLLSDPEPEDLVGGEDEDGDELDGIGDDIEDGVDAGKPKQEQVKCITVRSLDDLATLGFDWRSGKFRLYLYRTSPGTVAGTKATGRVAAYDHPISDDDVARIYGGEIYRVQVNGPMYADGTGQARWRAMIPRLEIPGDPKMTPNFETIHDLPLQADRATIARVTALEKEREGVVEKTTRPPGDAAPVVVPTTGSPVYDHLFAQVQAAQTRADDLMAKLIAEARRDPGSEDARAQAAERREQWDRILEAQHQAGQQQMQLMQALTGRGASTDERWLTSLDQARENLQRALSDAAEKHQAAMERAEQRWATERSTLMTSAAQRETDVRAVMQLQVDAERRVSDQLRADLTEARRRIDELQDKLGEARVQGAAATHAPPAKDPVEQLKSTAETFVALKGIFGGAIGGGEGAPDLAQLAFGALESGAIERTLGGIGARIASAWRVANPPAPNPVTTSADTAAWEQYQQAQRAAAKPIGGAPQAQQLPAGAGAKPRRARPQKPAPAPVQAPATAPSGLLPPELDVGVAEPSIEHVPLILDKAIQAGMPEEVFLGHFAPLLGPPEIQAQVAAVDNGAIVSMVEGATHGRLPFASKRYLSRVLDLFRETRAAQAAPAGQAVDTAPSPAVD